MSLGTVQPKGGRWKCLFNSSPPTIDGVGFLLENGRQLLSRVRHTSVTVLASSKANTMHGPRVYKGRDEPNNLPNCKSNPNESRSAMTLSLRSCATLRRGGNTWRPLRWLTRRPMMSHLKRAGREAGSNPARVAHSISTGRGCLG